MTPAPDPLHTAPPSVIRGWLIALLVSLAASLLIVAPFFWLGTASGHDFEFHATSWLDVAGQWKQGILYPRWTEWANHGFGEPRFIFYPPLSWMLAPALRFFMPWDDIPVGFIVLVQTFAGLSAFAFARRLLTPSTALFAAACYAANPNALLMIYLRSDYSELLASAFFPLLFLAAFELAGLLESDAPRRLAATVVFFSAMFAAVWLSNAPAAVMATYGATLLFAWSAFTDRSWQPLVRGAAGLALGFGLGACYIVPAAFEQRWVNISQALSTGLIPSENFLYTAINDAEHTFFNYIASTMAVTLMVFTGVAALAARREPPQPDALRAQPKLWNAFLLLAVVASALMLRFTSILWQVLPKLSFVQFPWRWMSILTIPFLYFLAATMARRRFRWPCVAAALALLTSTGVYFVQHTWWDDQDFPTLRASIEAGEGFDGTDEYDPIGDDHYNLPHAAPATELLPLTDDAEDSKSPDGAKIVVDRWTVSEKIIRIQSSQCARLALRLLNYPAWQVEVNGTRIEPQHPEDTGQMLVAIPAGESRVTVRFARTPDRTLGATLTLLSIVLAVVLLWSSCRGRGAL